MLVAVVSSVARRSNLTFADRTDLGCSGCKVCTYVEISFTKGVGCSGCKSYQLNI